MPLSAAQPHIVIVGAGFGGIEAALYLRERLGAAARLTLVTDRETFVFRPYLTYVPFGLVPDRLQVSLSALAEAHDVDVVYARARELDPFAKQLTVDAHRGSLAYDYLVLATGAHLGADEVVGLEAHAHLLWREHDLLLLRGALDRLVAKAKGGKPQRVALVAPPSSQWAGPLYEFAAMLDQWLSWEEARPHVSLQLFTSEAQFMEPLGPALHEALSRTFAQAHIEAHAGRHLREVLPDHLHFRAGEPVPYDLLIAAPTYTTSVPWKPLPLDERGFVQTELASRQVVGHDAIYAIGDVTDFPVKQAFLALLQADAAAEHIAARLLGTTPAFGFEPTTLWIMEQFGQALLTQAPVATGAASQNEEEVHLEPIPPGPHRRLVLYKHLRWSPQGANALYAGLLWKGTEIGLRALSGLTKP